MTLHVHDTFTDTDGTPLDGHDPDTAPVASSWFVTGPVIEIRSGRARVLDLVNGTGRATIDAEVSDALVTCTLYTGAADVVGQVGLIFRFVDANNYWRVTLDTVSGDVRLVEVTAGVETIRESDDAIPLGVAAYEVSLLLDGDNIRFAVAGRTALVYESSQHATATEFGLYHDMQASGAPSAMPEWDGLKVLDPPLLVYDTFTEGSDTDLNQHTPDTDAQGGGWAASNLTVDATADVATEATPRNEGIKRATIETGEADVAFTVDVTTGEASTNQWVGAEFRRLNAAETFRVELRVNDDAVHLYRVTGGSPLLLTSVSYTLATSTTYKLTVVLRGTSITIDVDGDTLIRVLELTHRTETKHGFYGQLVFQSGDTALAKWDNFRLHALTDVDVPDPGPDPYYDCCSGSGIDSGLAGGSYRQHVTAVTWGGASSTSVGATSDNAHCCCAIRKHLDLSVAITGTAATPAEVAIEWSPDCTHWFRVVRTIHVPTATGTYTWTIPLPSTATEVRLKFTAATGATSVCKAHLGLIDDLECLLAWWGEFAQQHPVKPALPGGLWDDPTAEEMTAYNAYIAAYHS